MGKNASLMESQTRDEKGAEMGTPMEVDKSYESVNKINLLKEQMKEIEKGVLKKDPKVIQKVVSRLLTTRKLLTEENLAELLGDIYPDHSDLSDWLIYQPKRSKLNKQHDLKDFPEISAYIHLLILMKLIDTGRLGDALICSDKLLEKISKNTSHTMDPIAAKFYFYYSRIYELNGKLDQIKTKLFTLFRKCVLRSDTCGQAVLINCILRNYLAYNLYESADKFVERVQFPDQSANNEWARYLYYQARIKATRLQYSDAQTNVVLALRKAPDASATGFRQAANKLAICIYLLLGEIPYKKTFTDGKMQASLRPYLYLTQAVRDGDLAHFGDILDQYGEKFRMDSTYHLILRLRKNVIRRAIRGIGLSYARISPAQVARKLGLDSAEEAQYILAKAIKDGVLEATFDGSYLVCHEDGDIYRTLTPTEIYKKRIAACLELHNLSVKAMRFPVKKYETKLDNAEEQTDLDDDFLDIFL